MDLLKGHLYDFASIPDTPTRTTTAYFTLEKFKNALQLGDHVFYNNMKLPIWFKPHLFELSHHGVYVGEAQIPAVKQNIVLFDPEANKRTTEEKEVRPAMDVPAILHVWPGKKKDKNSDLQYTSVEDFFNTALRTESAAYIIHDSSLGVDKRQQIVDKCKNFKAEGFEFDHLKNNCENFVNRCLYDTDTEIMKSKQVESYKKLETKLIKGAIAATAGVVGVGVAAKMLRNKTSRPTPRTTPHTTPHTTPRTNSRTTPRTTSSHVRGGGRRHPSRRTPSRRNPSPRRNRSHKRSSSRRTPNRRKAQKCR